MKVLTKIKLFIEWIKSNDIRTFDEFCFVWKPFLMEKKLGKEKVDNMLVKDFLTYKI